MSRKSFLKESLASKSVVDRVVDHITEAIIDGELKPGDKLPTEPELCDAFGVGRNSIREAIKILEAYGVVYIKRAEGTFVREDYNDKMLYPILYGIILQKDSADKIVELRKVIDIGILQVVMNKMTDEKTLQLENSLKGLEKELMSDQADAVRIFEADVHFHSIIVEIADNVMLKSIGNYVDKITRQTRIQAILDVLNSGNKDEFLKLHHKILSLLKEQDVKAISETIEEHYKYWQEKQDVL